MRRLKQWSFDDCEVLSVMGFGRFRGPDQTGGRGRSYAVGVDGVEREDRVGRKGWL